MTTTAAAAAKHSAAAATATATEAATALSLLVIYVQNGNSNNKMPHSNTHTLAGRISHKHTHTRASSISHTHTQTRDSCMSCAAFCSARSADLIPAVSCFWGWHCPSSSSPNPPILPIPYLLHSCLYIVSKYLCI